MPPKQTRRNYRGRAIDVSYDVRRCIHVAECMRGLPQTFNRQHVPWIEPDKSPPADVAEVVMRCPSGALRFERKDAGLPESIAAINTITLVANGPLYVRGEVKLISPQGAVLHQDRRVSLCRCGASKNKPFCDNSHIAAGYKSGTPKIGSRVDRGMGGALQITPIENGPYQLLGNVEVVDAEQVVVFQGRMIRLCRCGRSEEMPFCDNSHLDNGFEAQSW
ncbi:MAG: CDGSH iron-sulfur domain-containing protein [Anaerolineae bacterium]|nr:MAG: CDGSH iron-sulfur domain-containing protein [Anaerolineae bacterium]